MVIPFVTLVFAYNLLRNKPPTYEPPVIPNDYPGLPKRWFARIGGFVFDARFLAVFVLLFGFLVSFVVSTQGFPPKFVYDALGVEERNALVLISPDKSKEQVLVAAGRSPTYFNLDETGERYRELFSQQIGFVESEEDLVLLRQQVSQQVRAEEQLFFSQSENDVAPYNLVFGLLITFSLVAYVLLYYSSIYKRRVQEKVQRMESEFKDSLYVLASRMGENKPVEDAMQHVVEFLPNLSVSKEVFGRTLDNIKLLGMPLEQAVFDKNVGSVASVPSEMIRSSMKMLVDAVQLGVNVAARTMISLSIQLQNAQKVNDTLRILVSDVTGTMKTMILFIAPIVLGITTSLQRIVIVTIASIASSDLGSSLESIGSGVGGEFAGNFSSLSKLGFISPDAVANIASPTQFIIIIAIYIVELVVIMTYFTTKIEEDNDLLVKLNLATYLPIAVIVFVFSMIVSNALVGSI